MTEAMTIRQETDLLDAATANEIRAQVNRIQEVMQAVMKSGIHFGVIPGAGDKPTLFKPGAEKIFATFRIAVDPVVESETRLPDEYSVRIKAVATCNGRELGSAMGEASSNEEKYRWRKALCQEEYDEATEDMRRMAFKRYQGKINRVPQLRVHVADISNTILKMAVKRAEVALCLQVTGASDVFAQDIEDLPPGMVHDESAPPPPTMPKRKSKKPPKPTKGDNAPSPAPPEDLELGIESELIGVIKSVAERETKTGKIRYGVCITTDDGEKWANTFDKKLYDDSESIKGQAGILHVKTTQYGLDLIGVGQA